MVLRILQKPLIALAMLCLSLPVFAATDAAGEIGSLKGDVTATRDGQTRDLSEGDKVYANEMITTKDDGLAEIQFVDDSNFILGPGSEFKIDEFSYNKPNQENKMSTKLVKGAFRFVTGLIARYKPDSMEVSTAVATIGIRGTTVAVEADATSAVIVLEEPKDKSRKTAIEVSNEFGSTYIDEPGYGTEVPDQFSAPSPKKRMRLRTVNNLMRSIQSMQRINIPRPNMRH